MPESNPTPPDGSTGPFPRGANSHADASTHDGQPLLFGRYRVIRELGRGGFGVVLLAHDGELGQSVAVKLVPGLVAKDTEGISDLKREVLRGMALTHPGIVRTHTFERDADTAAIVMEYVDGETLAELKTRQPDGCFEPEQVVPWIEQLCEALDYAHREARIVHRDLKPRNLMLTSSGKLKVADFGIAASLSDSLSRLTARGDTSGTLCYMSPQQARGFKPAPGDDIYAFGATLYELLTGKPPFFRGNIQLQLLGEPVPPMSERRAELGVLNRPALPAAWEAVVAACLAKDPADRPQSAGELLVRLRAETDAAPHANASSESATQRASGTRRDRLSSLETAPTQLASAPDATFMPRLRHQPSPGGRFASRFLAVMALALVIAFAGWRFRHRGDAAASAARAEEDAQQLAAEAERQRQANTAEDQRRADEAEKRRLAAELTAKEKEAAVARQALRVTEMLRAGDVALQAQDFANARKRYSEVLALAADNADAQEALKRVDQAEAADMARRKMEQQVASTLLAGNVAAAKKDWPEARRQYRAVLTIDAANADALASLKQVDEIEKAFTPAPTPARVAVLPKAKAPVMETPQPRSVEGREFVSPQFRARFVKLQFPKGGDIVVYLEFSPNESAKEIGLTLGGNFPSAGYTFALSDPAAERRKELQQAPTILRASTGEEYRLSSVSGLVVNSFAAPITSGLSPKNRTSVIYRFTEAEGRHGKTPPGGTFSLDSEIVVCVRGDPSRTTDPFSPIGSVNIHFDDIR